MVDEVSIHHSSIFFETAGASPRPTSYGSSRTSIPTDFIYYLLSIIYYLLSHFPPPYIIRVGGNVDLYIFLFIILSVIFQAGRYGIRPCICDLQQAFQLSQYVKRIDGRYYVEIDIRKLFTYLVVCNAFKRNIEILYRLGFFYLSFFFSCVVRLK